MKQQDCYLTSTRACSYMESLNRRHYGECCQLATEYLTDFWESIEQMENSRLVNLIFISLKYSKVLLFRALNVGKNQSPQISSRLLKSFAES